MWYTCSVTRNKCKKLDHYFFFSLSPLHARPSFRKHYYLSRIRSTALPLLNKLKMLAVLPFNRAQLSTIRIPSKLLLSGPDLLQHHSMRLSNRADGKQTIHVLERQPLCLGHQEPDKCNTDDHHGREENVHAVPVVAHFEKHGRCEAGDDEVPEPVCSGGGGLAEGAGVEVEHFAVDYPDGAVPRGRVEEGPEVEEESNWL